MKKINFKKVLMSTVSLIAAAVIACPAQVFAYDQDKCNETPEEGLWYVSSESTGAATATVSVIMMIQPEYANGNFETAYTFYCTNGKFTCTDGYTETHGTMAYDIKSVNKHVTSSTVGESPIWRGDFRLEPGTYELSDGATAMTVSNVVALRQNLESPLEEDGYGAQLDDTVVKDNDHLDIYLLVGESEWITDKKNVDAFSEWAKKNEAMRNSNGIVAGETQDSTETTAASTEVTESIDGQTTAVQSTEASTVEASTVEPSYTEAAESSTMEDETMEHTSNPFIVVILAIILAAILIVGILILILSRKERK